MSKTATVRGIPPDVLKDILIDEIVENGVSGTQEVVEYGEPSTEEKCARALELLYKEGTARAKEFLCVLDYSPHLNFSQYLIGYMLHIPSNSPYLSRDTEEATKLMRSAKPRELELLIIEVRRSKIDCIGDDYQNDYMVKNNPLKTGALAQVHNFHNESARARDAKHVLEYAPWTCYTQKQIGYVLRIPGNSPHLSFAQDGSFVPQQETSSDLCELLVVNVRRKRIECIDVHHREAVVRNRPGTEMSA